jgi:hypothetical protein
LASHIVKTHVPSATDKSDAAVDKSFCVDTVNVVAVSSGQQLCTFDESELLRKLQVIPSAQEAVLALLNAVRHRRRLTGRE